MLQNFIDILAAPTAAFTRLKQAPVFWPPLVLLIVLSVSTQLGYFFMNDAGFVRDEIVAQSTAGRDLTQEQRKQIEAGTARVNIPTIAGISSAAVVIIVPVIMSLMALYLGFMAKFSLSELGFRHWMTLQCWATVPTLFAALAAWLILLTNSNGQVTQAELQPLSVAGLLGLHLKSQTLQQFNLLQLWGLALTVTGYRQWTNADWLKSTVIVLAPSVLIYGGIAYFS